MGTLFAFTCPDCGHVAEASGGRDVGMIAVVETSICRSCHELVDVVIGFFGGEGPCGDAERDRALGRCPKCDGTAVYPWPPSRPCPKCGKTMKRGGLIAQWD